MTSSTHNDRRNPQQFELSNQTVLVLLLLILVAGVTLLATMIFRDLHWRVTVFIAATAATAALFCWVTRNTTCWDIFHPSWGLLLLLALYSIASGLYIERNGRTYYGEPLIEGVYWRYYIACWMAQLGVCFGLALKVVSSSESFKNSIRTVGTNNLINRQLLVFAIIVCVACLPWLLPKLNFLSVKSYRETALSVRVERLGNDTAGIMEVATQYIPVTLMLIVCIGAMFRQSTPIAWRIISAALVGAYFVTGFLGGERYTVLYCGLFLTMYWYYRVRPLNPLTVFAVGFSAYVIMNLIPIIRYTANPIEMWQLLTDSLAKDGLSEFELGKSNELLTAVNLARQIQGILLGESELNWGASVVSDVLVWIPRAFYENRPLPTSEKFVEVFYPGVREIGGGYGFFIVQEGHWAFGVLGPAIFMAFFGYFVAMVHAAVMRWRDFDVVVFWYAAVYADLVMASVRSGIIGSIKAAMLHSVPFFAIALMLFAVRVLRPIAK